MYEVSVAMLAFIAVLCLGGAVIKVRDERRRAILARLHPELQKAARVRLGPRQGMVTALGALGKTVSRGKQSSNLRQELARAGFHDKSAAPVFLGLKVLLLFLGGAVPFIFLAQADLAPTTKLLVPVLVGVFLFFVPNAVVAWRRKKRCEDVRHSLPDVVDLIEVCISAGMSLDAAWNLVAGEMRGLGPTLADEMALTNLEIHLGATREEAVRHMAARTDAEELASLVAVMGQSERFGVSIAETLQTFAKTLREERVFRAEEQGEKMAVRMIFPLVLFIFPALFVVLVGPTVVKLVGMLAT